jgi:hypothetical protein
MLTRFLAYSARVAAPHDSVMEATIVGQLPDAFIVTVAGNVSLLSDLGATVVLAAVPANTIIPLRHQRINATGTTATGIFCLFQRTG